MRDVQFDRIEADLDNIRAAIARAVDDGDTADALGIAADLRAFWLERNHSAEGVRTLVALIDESDRRHVPEFAPATAAAAAISTWLGDYATSRRMGELSVRGVGSAGRISGSSPTRSGRSRSRRSR